MHEFLKPSPGNALRMRRATRPTTIDQLGSYINQTVYSLESNPHKSFQENFEVFLRHQENSKNRFTATILEKGTICMLYEVKKVLNKLNG